MDPLILTPSRESSISLMAVKSAHLRAARGPLLCWERRLGWAAVQQLNSPLLRAAIICSTIYLSQRAVWITAPRSMAGCHMMNIVIHNTSGATLPVSLHRMPPCWFHPANLPHVGSSIPAGNSCPGNCGKKWKLKQTKQKLLRLFHRHTGLLQQKALLVSDNTP